jgi:regulator of sirC expression with transglutaminase-like and TPR domain
MCMDLDEALAFLAKNPACSLDVAELTLLLAADEYPALDVEGCLAEIDAMAHDARRYIRGSLDSRVQGLCRYLFHEMGFHGNTQDYYDPRNSYLNEVLDRRTGIPISLGAVAMAVGRRVGLKVVGIGLPGHFVVKACGAGGEVMFDPFHGGRRLTPDLCAQLVCKTTGMCFRATPEQLRPVPLGDMLVRVLTNLKVIYVRSGDFARAVRVLRRLRQLCPKEPEYMRDLGLSMLGMGQTGKAIDQLTAYASSGPKDADNVQRVIEEARSELARWN